jgi:hypothetical protein
MNYYLIFQWVLPASSISKAPPLFARLINYLLIYVPLKNYWLIDYLLFYVPLKNISLIWRRHHYWWRAAKFRPMLHAQGLWAGRDLYRATPAVARGLGFSGLIRRTTPFSRLLRHTRGCGGSILTRILTGLSRIIHWYGDVTIAGEGLQNLGLCSAPLNRGRIFIVPHLLWQVPSFFSGRIRKTAAFSRLLPHTRGCGRPILTRILTGVVC